MRASALLKNEGGKKKEKEKKATSRSELSPLFSSSLFLSHFLFSFLVPLFSRARKSSADTDSLTAYTCTCTRGRAVVRERIIRLRRESARPSSLLPALSPLSRYLLSFSLFLLPFPSYAYLSPVSFSLNLSEYPSLSHCASSACFASVRLSLTIAFSHSRRPSPSPLVRPVTSLFSVGREETVRLAPIRLLSRLFRLSRATAPDAIKYMFVLVVRADGSIIRLSRFHRVIGAPPRDLRRRRATTCLLHVCP